MRWAWWMAWPVARGHFLSCLVVRGLAHGAWECPWFEETGSRNLHGRTWMRREPHKGKASQICIEVPLSLFLKTKLWRSMERFQEAGHKSPRKLCKLNHPSGHAGLTDERPLGRFKPAVCVFPALASRHVWAGKPWDYSRSQPWSHPSWCCVKQIGSLSAEPCPGWKFMMGGSV